MLSKHVANHGRPDVVPLCSQTAAQFAAQRWLWSVAAGKKATRGICAYAPGAITESAERGCGNFLRHEIYKKSVNYVEAGIGIEGQVK